MTTETPDPLAGLAADTPVSMQTLAVTGILVDVYGLDELPLPRPTHVSVLWLHNPRLGDRARMAPVARRVVGEYHSRVRAGAGVSTRGLIAAAFGMWERRGEQMGKRHVCRLVVSRRRVHACLFLSSFFLGGAAHWLTTPTAFGHQQTSAITAPEKSTNSPI